MYNLFEDEIGITRPEMLEHDDRVGLRWIVDGYAGLGCLFGHKQLILRELAVADQCRRFNLPGAKLAVALHHDQAVGCTIADRDGPTGPHRQFLCAVGRRFVANPAFAVATAGVAEAIGKTLAESGAAVDVRAMADVKDLTPYDAVVAGSAIQGKQWLPEAMQFMQTHQTTLRQKPFAAFLVCMTLAMKKGNYRAEVANWLQPVRTLAPPVSEGLFAGALDISKVPTLSLIHISEPTRPY